MSAVVQERKAMLPLNDDQQASMLQLVEHARNPESNLRQLALLYIAWLRYLVAVTEEGLSQAITIAHFAELGDRASVRRMIIVNIELRIFGGTTYQEDTKDERIEGDTGDAGAEPKAAGSQATKRRG